MTYAPDFEGRLWVLAEWSSHSEVDYFEIFLIVTEKHDVFGFKVTVHDSVRVAVVYAGKDLFEIQASLTLCEAASFDDSVKELASLAVVHDYENFFVLGVDIVNTDDVRMVLNEFTGTSRLRIRNSSRFWRVRLFFSMRLAARKTLVCLCLTL